MSGVVKLQHQGGLDGLCGVYAVVNAAYLCGVKDQEAIFKAACRAIPRKRWPNPLWNGINFNELKVMARRSVRDLPDRRIRVRSPFQRTPPRDNETYWKKFDAIFEDEGTVCAIMGVEYPTMHWIVARKDGRRVSFADSRAGKLLFRKNRASLYAGRRALTPSQWRINPGELLVFSDAPSP